jgi:uncharacterized protein YndB with AHSA1/START domain
MRTTTAVTEIDAPSGAVWSAITGIDHVCGWWGATTGVVSPSLGALWLFVWRGDTKAAFRFFAGGAVAGCTPRERFEIADYAYLNPERPVFDHMRLVFRMESLKQTKTLLHVEQSGYRSGEHWDCYYDEVKSAWPTVIQSLKVYVEGQD